MSLQRDSDPFDRITSVLEAYFKAGAFGGAAAGVYRGGGYLYASGVGTRDLAHNLPVETDTIYRIASLSKPITSVAAMMLYQEGRFALDESIDSWAPEFRDMKVLRSANGPIDDCEPAVRPISFEDLLTHRSGIVYSDLWTGPICTAYVESVGPQIDNERSPDEWIAALAALPLVDQPGALFYYGHSTDLLGIVIARMEGKSLGRVLKDRIFGPLQMHDTGFVVPNEKRDRQAGLHGFDSAGHLVTLTTVPGEHALRERPANFTFESGGQGLWSTLDDFVRFARLFSEGGTVDGVNLLHPEIVELMCSNCLTPIQRAESKLFGMRPFASGHGFGLGVAVVMEPESADTLRCGGDAGSVGWPGAYGSWWQADPNDRSVMAFLTHNMANPDQLLQGMGLAAWEAIAEFQGIASGLLRLGR